MFSPPLGSVSTVIALPGEPLRVFFTLDPVVVAVTVACGLPEVWTNIPAGDWHAVPLRPLPSHSAVPGSASAPASAPSPVFVARVDVPPDVSSVGQRATFEFTYRFRRHDHSYLWLGHLGCNGRIHVVSSPTPELASAGDVTVHSFPLSSSPPPSVPVDFPLKDLLESLVPGLSAADASTDGLVLERSRRHWLVPRSLSNGGLASLSNRFLSQFLVLRRDRRLVVFLPVSTPRVVSSLVRVDLDTPVLRCVRDSVEDASAPSGSLVTAVGLDGDLHALVDACVSAAAGVLTPTPGHGRDHSVVHMQPIGLTWCTWNALGQSYTLSQVLACIDALQASSVGPAIDAVLLDDGWQDTTSIDGRRCLRSFDLRDGWFDSLIETRNRGLSGAVKRIKRRHIRRVGVWVTITGYWDAIDPSSSLADQFPLTSFRVNSPDHPDWDRTWYFPASPADISRFYMSYFGAIKLAGVDFIKIDDQSDVDFLSFSVDDNAKDIGLVRNAIFRCCLEAAREVFGVGNVIHCMAGSPHLWNGPLALLPPPLDGDHARRLDPIRNSDDFSPDQSDDDAHRYHIANNFRTSVLSRAFERQGLVPDFDMCQAATASTGADARSVSCSELPSPPSWGPFHVAARAFQVAPVMSTDDIRQHGLTRDPPSVPDGPEGDTAQETSRPDLMEAWHKILAPTLHGLKVLTTQTTGTVLEGRLGEDFLGEREEDEGQVEEWVRVEDECGSGNQRCLPALKVGAGITAAAGALLGWFNCLPHGCASSDVVDARDIVDALGAARDRERDYVIVFPPRQSTNDHASLNDNRDGEEGVEIEVARVTRAELDSARGTSRVVARPLAGLRLAAREAVVACAAPVFRLPGGGIACVGLVGKHAGLAAISSITTHVPGVDNADTDLSRPSSASRFGLGLDASTGPLSLPRRLASFFLSEPATPEQQPPSGPSASAGFTGKKASSSQPQPPPPPPPQTLPLLVRTLRALVPHAVWVPLRVAWVRLRLSTLFGWVVGLVIAAFGARGWGDAPSTTATAPRTTEPVQAPPSSSSPDDKREDEGAAADASPATGASAVPRASDVDSPVPTTAREVTTQRVETSDDGVTPILRVETLFAGRLGFVVLDGRAEDVELVVVVAGTTITVQSPPVVPRSQPVLAPPTAAATATTTTTTTTAEATTPRKVGAPRTRTLSGLWDVGDSINGGGGGGNGDKEGNDNGDDKVASSPSPVLVELDLAEYAECVDADTGLWTVEVRFPEKRPS